MDGFPIPKKYIRKTIDSNSLSIYTMNGKKKRKKKVKKPIIMMLHENFN